MHTVTSANLLLFYGLGYNRGHFPTTEVYPKQCHENEHVLIFTDIQSSFGVGHCFVCFFLLASKSMNTRYS